VVGEMMGLQLTFPGDQRCVAARAQAVARKPPVHFVNFPK